MGAKVFDRFKVIDVDCHITEPPDLWSSRMSKSRENKIPHIERIDGVDCWVIDGLTLYRPGFLSMAGFDGFLPDNPKTFEEIPASMYDSSERLKHMDAEGIYAEVLYPNVGGFGNGRFLDIKDRDLIGELVSVYNDWQTDWTSVDPNRLLAVTSVPFWDVDLVVKEVIRCQEMGHRSINFCNAPEDFGFPPLYSDHWNPLWAVAQEVQVPIAFHIGGGDIGKQLRNPEIGWRATFAKYSASLFFDNYKTMGELIFGGVCHRFPDLKFISVESGVGWIPNALESMDWQWQNGGVFLEHPEYDLLPSEYFRRQIYGSFWFETAPAVFAIQQYPDNIMYETDFPHPTCQHPAPQSEIATHPRDYAEAALSSLPDDLLAKVLHDNAAELYKL